MPRHQKSTLQALVISDKGKLTTNNRYKFYLTTTVIWMGVAFILIGYNMI